MRRRHREESRRGGSVGNRPSGPPLARSLDMQALGPCTSPAAILLVLGAAMRALCELPTDTRVTNALALLATSTARLIETSDLDDRVTALEQHHRTPARATAPRSAARLSVASGRLLPGVPRSS